MRDEWLDEHPWPWWHLSYTTKLWHDRARIEAWSRGVISLMAQVERRQP